MWPGTATELLNLSEFINGYHEYQRSSYPSRFHMIVKPTPLLWYPLDFLRVTSSVSLTNESPFQFGMMFFSTPTASKAEAVCFLCKENSTFQIQCWNLLLGVIMEENISEELSSSSIKCPRTNIATNTFQQNVYIKKQSCGFFSCVKLELSAFLTKHNSSLFYEYIVLIWHFYYPY